MLRSLSDLEQYTVSAADGGIGNLVNFHLDDERWAVRYLVVATSGLLNARLLLASPISVRPIECGPRRLFLTLTKAKFLDYPGVEVDKPLSRQFESDYNRYFGYAPYWGHSGLWGTGAYPALLATENWHDTPAKFSKEAGEIHLRGACEVRGYHVQGLDDTVGHIDDFIVDDETWEVRYLAIATNHWSFGKKVLVAPKWANHVSWTDGKVYLDLSREAIKNSPEWDATTAINREYETYLHDYYGRPQYWGRSDRP